MLFAVLAKWVQLSMCSLFHVGCPSCWSSMGTMAAMLPLPIKHVIIKERKQGIGDNSGHRKNLSRYVQSFLGYTNHQKTILVAVQHRRNCQKLWMVKRFTSHDLVWLLSLHATFIQWKSLSLNHWRIGFDDQNNHQLYIGWMIYHRIVFSSWVSHSLRVFQPSPLENHKAYPTQFYTVALWGGIWIPTPKKCLFIECTKSIRNPGCCSGDGNRAAAANVHLLASYSKLILCHMIKLWWFIIIERFWNLESTWSKFDLFFSQYYCCDYFMAPILMVKCSHPCRMVGHIHEYKENNDLTSRHHSSDGEIYRWCFPRDIHITCFFHIFPWYLPSTVYRYFCEW